MFKYLTLDRIFFHVSKNIYDYNRYTYLYVIKQLWQRNFNVCLKKKKKKVKG